MKLSLANAFTLHRKTRSGCDVIVTFLQELKLQYGANKGKAYTEEEDRFILCQVHLLGYGQWDELKAAIRDHWRFRFDWFFKSRTPQVCFTLGAPTPNPVPISQTLHRAVFPALMCLACMKPVNLAVNNCKRIF